MTELTNELKARLIQTIDTDRSITDEELSHIISRMVNGEYLGSHAPVRERLKTIRELQNSIRGLDILEDLLEDEGITEIMINGPSEIFIEKNGIITACDGAFSSAERLSDIIQTIVSQSNKRVNESSPIVDTRLPDGSRINVVLPPVSVNGACVTIRKFPKEAITMDTLISLGSITTEAALFLKDLTRAGYNIFISGGTGSGKTTFLNALSDFIPADERIITIEDSAELQIRNIKNLIRLECRQANTEGENEITIRDLIRTSLRMRPTRIIVGECRGGEAFDMLQAMNTGHDGSLSTGHANSPADMLTRLEMMVLMAADMPLAAIRSQISSALDILIHLGRLPDGSRKVLEISEICGMEDGEIVLSPLYIFSESKGSLIKTENTLKSTRKLTFKGITDEKKYS